MKKYNLHGVSTLVTGADGFIGSHLVEELVIAGAKVRAFVFYNSFNLIPLDSSLESMSSRYFSVVEMRL